MRITTLFVISLLSSFGPLSAQYANKVNGNFNIGIEDGVAYFHGIKIGDKLADIESKFGKTGLVSQPTNQTSLTSYFYPDHGLEFSLEGEYVRVILLYPTEGSVMGDISKFKIFSRNKSTWSHKDLTLNKAQPQDIIRAMGVENMNTKIGSGFTSSISNNVMGFRLINSGGSQDIIFYFDSSTNTLEHMANRLSK